MDEEERFAIFIALREMQEWEYLGNGKWKEPDYVIESRKNQEELKRRKRG